MKKLLSNPLILSLLGALTAGGAVAAPAGYRYQTVDYPGAANTALYAINDLRQWVGAEKDTSGRHHAIVGNASGLALLDLSALGADVVESWAFSIDTQGDIAGETVDAAGESHGYLHHADGSVEAIEVPGGNNTQAYGVNDHGEIIGQYDDPAGAIHAFKRVDGQFIDIDLPGGVQTVPLSVDNAGQVAGEFIRTDGTIGDGYLQDADGRFTLHSAPGAPPQSTFYISLNNRGEVLGAYADAQGNQVNFLRRGSKTIPIDLPASFGATALSAQTINDGDDVVGYYIDANGVAHGVTALAR